MVVCVVVIVCVDVDEIEDDDVLDIHPACNAVFVVGGVHNVHSYIQ